MAAIEPGVRAPFATGGCEDGWTRPVDYLDYLARRGRAFVHPWGQAGTDVLLGAMRPGGGQRILEIGCGTGATLVRLASVSDAEVSGVDVSEQMLKMATHRMADLGLTDRVRLSRMSKSGEFAFSDGVFDTIYCESVLAILAPAELARTLLEVFRCLKPGGCFLANEAIWKPEATAYQIDQINGTVKAALNLIQSSAQPGYLGEWLAMFTAAGFAIESFALMADLSPTVMPMSPEAAEISRRSDAFTRRMRIRGYLNPRKLLQAISVTVTLRRLRGSGQWVESRLFVLRK